MKKRVLIKLIKYKVKMKEYKIREDKGRVTYFCVPQDGNPMYVKTVQGASTSFRNLTIDEAMLLSKERASIR